MSSPYVARVRDIAGAPSRMALPTSVPQTPTHSVLLLGPSCPRDRARSSLPNGRPPWGHPVTAHCSAHPGRHLTRQCPPAGAGLAACWLLRGYSPFRQRPRAPSSIPLPRHHGLLRPRACRPPVVGSRSSTPLRRAGGVASFLSARGHRPLVPGPWPAARRHLGSRRRPGPAPLAPTATTPDARRLACRRAGASRLLNGAWTLPAPSSSRLRGIYLPISAARSWAGGRAIYLPFIATLGGVGG